MYTPVAYQGNETEEQVFKKREVFKEDLKRGDRCRMADRNRELVPDNWSLVRERALTTAFSNITFQQEQVSLLSMHAPAKALQDTDCFQ